MTAPNQPNPAGSATQGGLAAFASKTAAQRKTEATAPVKNSLETNFFGSWITNLFGGFIGGIAGLVSGLFSNIFGGGSGGGFLDLIGGFLGIKDDVDQVVNVTVPSLQNQINDISEGGVSASRAFFGTSGTWTRPAGEWSRHVIDVIGGGSGGACPNGDGATTFRAGGWVGGWAQEEFFDSDLPSTLTVTVGLGGAGGTTSNRNGNPGQQSQVVGWVAAGGGLIATSTDGAGFGAKTIRTLRGGNGGSSVVGASAGTGHDYATGGIAGSPSNSGTRGGDGNTPVPATRAYPGTGGGGGANEGTVGQPGGNGGNGGYPGGAGGGGGNGGPFGGPGGAGGNGAGGGVWITSYK